MSGARESVTLEGRAAIEEVIKSGYRVGAWKSRASFDAFMATMHEAADIVWPKGNA